MSVGELAINGSPKALTADPHDVFDWPVIIEQNEAAVLDVLRRGATSINVPVPSAVLS